MDVERGAGILEIKLAILDIIKTCWGLFFYYSCCLIEDPGALYNFKILIFVLRPTMFLWQSWGDYWHISKKYQLYYSLCQNPTNFIDFW